MLATRLGQIEVVRELLNRGADPNHHNYDGEQAIDAALDRGYPNIIRILSTFNANPFISDPTTGISNFAIVAANGPFGQLKAMIDENVDLNLNQQDQDGNTPLIFAINNRKSEHVSLLLDRGADPNLGNRGGGTPLAYAITSNQEEIKQMLLDAGAK
jgi:ankyrin repeat protein